MTPSQKLFEGEVVNTLIPSSMGEIGILPGHAELVGIVGVGLLKPYTKEGQRPAKVLLLSGGLFTLEEGVLTIMADRALPVEGDSAEHFQQQYDLLERELEGIDPSDTERYHEIQVKLQETVALAFGLRH